MSNYYDMREGKVKIAEALMNRGWKVYGYYEDESDSMTDYYSPACWLDGIAEKNGYILVIDNSSESKGKEITRYNPKGNLSIDDREKISKLEAMTQVNGATAGEEQNAKTLIEKIKGKITEQSAYEVIGIIPAHMGNPGKCKWHIEKDGKIYDKGTGITKYSDIPESYIFDINKMEYTEQYKQEWTGTDENGCRIMTDRKLPEETRKIINDFKSLILRFERIVNGMNSCGDGTAETEVKGQEQVEKTGYEKVTVKETKTGLKMVEVANDKEIKVGLYLSFKYHGGFWLITDARQRTGTWKINGVATKLTKNSFDYEQVGAESRGYKQTKNGKRYYQWEDSLLKEIANGSAKLYELKEVTEEIEVEKWVKIDKIKNTYNTKTESKKEETKEQQKPEQAQENINNDIYTIIADTDTRDNSPLWVVKLVNRVSTEEYNRIRNEVMKPIDGYYSRFKGGFIFKYDPTSKLIADNKQAEQKQEVTEEKQPENTTVENIIDMSTKFITELNISGETICNNDGYLTKMFDYITNNNISITDDIFNYLGKEDYKNLSEVLRLIDSGYYHPVKDGFIYDCHFKAWDIPINEIQEAITALNISWYDMGDKIGFKGLTAEQTKQVKEISDINGSIFFIDSEISKNEYNTIIEEQIEQEKTEINNVIDFDEYKNNSEVEQVKNNNSFDEDILSKFDNVEINNNSRISASDEEFCKEQENGYKQFIKFSDSYIQYLESNSFKNSLFNSQSLINEMNTNREGMKEIFINKIVDYFKDTYKVTLTAEPIHKKYDLTIDYNTIVSEVIEQLGGYNFSDKAEKEIKDEFIKFLNYKDIKVKNCKISIEDFFYIDSYSKKYNTYEIGYGSDEKFYKLFKAFSHFLYHAYESYFNNLYYIITREKDDAVFKTHDIANNGIKTLKLYKNGKIDIEYSSTEYAQKFAKEYCGYIEKSA